MGLSRILDKEYKTSDSLNVSCSEGHSDCMFNINGTCSAEWCIFKELPKMITTGKNVKCKVCKKNTTNVSVYSGQNEYICNDCLQKIYNIIENPKCGICGKSVELGESICSSCRSELESSSKCAICGTKTSLGKSICSTCATRIRGKLNE